MTKPMPQSAFERLPPRHDMRLDDGLSGAIDAVADYAPATQRMLRFGWYAAAIAAYGGNARTALVSRDDAPVIALPMIATGPAWLRAATVPGCYWPFRSFPAREDAGVDSFEALLDTIAGTTNILRIGPVPDDDPSLAMLRTAARSRGWAAVPRHIAHGYLLDTGGLCAQGQWPRGSTLRKNRFHEKHLAAHGALEWRFVSGDAWDGAGFDALADIEMRSWIATRTDGGDAKFTRTGHGVFWRKAVADPVLAQMFWAAVLDVDGRPAAFSFDINAGTRKYAIANSYDPAFAKHSPGKLLYYRNLSHAIEQGITDVDWGAGDSGYKTVIGAQRGAALRDWLFVRPGVPAAMARMMAGLWRRSGNSSD